MKLSFFVCLLILACSVTWYFRSHWLALLGGAVLCVLFSVSTVGILCNLGNDDPCDPV